MNALFDQIYANLVKGGAWLTILKGLWATVKISGLSLVIGTLIGALICALRMNKVRPIRWVAQLYIAVLRGSPVLMLLMLMYYVVFARSRIDAAYVAVATFSLNIAAHIAELMRASLMATDGGQVEAARTLGFSRFSAFRLITLPQAAHIAKPVYQSTIVNLIQWTSVVGYVTIFISTEMENTKINLCMALTQDNEALRDTLDKAIGDMLADGTIDALRTAYIDDFKPDSEPERVTMPVIEGAETLRVVVTGDLPPLDYVSADGVPAGYNVAMLAKLSELIGMNIEIVTSNAGSRAIMLASGRADVIFWMYEVLIEMQEPDDPTPETAGSYTFSLPESEGVLLVTQPYIVDTVAYIEKAQ